MRMPRLSHVAPEELLVLPLIVVAILGVLLQPSAITRLFEEQPYATPDPESPGRSLLQAVGPTATPNAEPGFRPEPRSVGPSTVVAPDRSPVPPVLGPRITRLIDPCAEGQTSHAIEATPGTIFVFDRQGAVRTLPDQPGQAFVIMCAPATPNARPVNIYVGPGRFATSMC
jgi:hypothetical protein